MRTKDFDEAIVWLVDDPVSDCKVVEYQPGNGTRYQVMFSKVPRQIQENQWVVSLIDGALAGRCATFYAGSGMLSCQHVGRELKLPKDAIDDLAVLTELIGHILGRETPSALDVEGYRERLVDKIQSE